MDDTTILLIAAVGAAFALSGGLTAVGEGAAHSANDITGVLPWIEGQVDSFEHWVGGWV